MLNSELIAELVLASPKHSNMPLAELSKCDRTTIIQELTEINGNPDETEL